MISVIAAGRWSRVAETHLVSILLVAFGVFFFRDVLPFATYTDVPADAKEGWLLWTKLGILSVTAVGVPLLIPRPYIPHDPKVNGSRTATIIRLTLEAESTSRSERRANSFDPLLGYLSIYRHDGIQGVLGSPSGGRPVASFA